MRPFVVMGASSLSMYLLSFFCFFGAPVSFSLGKEEGAWWYCWVPGVRQLTSEY